jgi:hypothetical protein
VDYHTSQLLGLLTESKMIRASVTDSQNTRVIATKHGAFAGLFRRFLIWAATTAPMLIFGEQIRAFLYSAVDWLIAFALNYQFANSLYETIGGSEPISQGLYWLGTASWSGGYFYLVVVAYVVDALFYIRKMPHDLVLCTETALTLAKPVEVLDKGTRKKILATDLDQKISWISPKKLSIEDIWDEEDFIDAVTIDFVDIKSLWLNPEPKNYQRLLAQGKPAYGTLILLTADDKLYAQPIISDLHAVEKALSDIVIK